ncbi:NADPH-dependent 7-cyano-7-deazaguanine reductase QueF [Thiomicrorhabdus sp. zzn3]|uniref:NADPH-dependent 7-cyano-7-deazaguanine reductase QueF n=1 Tax=Thiomicrorhabdus sp. zzn3 TaxID=3039775 RepID=UPI0024364F2A|nr:NADPH-dependent 7-cyano-7-deazaguanine reductase QueF [Thiomicrorhabdus sp. zzn3]MDG6778723.1 NADPH-dependent 7-cyano-7-deazaguanine reductase QueF [Thiomicrorhabdus sp. zzn3]
MKTKTTASTAEKSLLGQSTPYCASYDPSILFPVPRQEKRDELGFDQSSLPFQGLDIWTAFEVSWLNAKGKPVVAIAEFAFPADSPNLIESKSFKLYLNSFNGTRFESQQQVEETWMRDLSRACGGEVAVELRSLDEDETLIGRLPGINLDDLDIEVSDYQVTPELLRNEEEAEVVEETLNSHLLKSNCLVTGQPDWGSVVIHYRGPKIDREALLRYLISFREHNEFHEQCVERIFTDLMKHCQTVNLTVYARYVRRGGLDINPYRSNFEDEFDISRTVRQ